MSIKIKDSPIENSKSEKPLGVTIDSNFSFDNHIDIYRKTSQNIHSSFRVASHIFDKNKHFRRNL